MEAKEEIARLDKQLTKGWMLYKPFLDANRENEPLAVELRYTLAKLQTLKAELELANLPDKVQDFIKENG